LPIIFDKGGYDVFACYMVPNTLHVTVEKSEVKIEIFQAPNSAIIYTCVYDTCKLWPANISRHICQYSQNSSIWSSV